MIDTVKAWAKSMDKNDLSLIVSTVLTLVVWWTFIGRNKYSTKGMRNV